MTGCEGVAVRIVAQHLYVGFRGVKHPETGTATIALKGVLREADVKREFQLEATTLTEGLWS